MQNLVTVFGGSGFVGRQAVRQLAKAGWRVRVAVRNPNLAYAMRLAGDVGQVDLVQANVRNEASVARALEGASAAVNLVAVPYETGRQTFQALHVDGARTVARAARAAGATRLVHMSVLGADANSKSKFARSRAEGETAVREGFPDAVVLRPSVVFGPEDDFFNRFASMAAMSPALPLVGGGHTRFQPVFVSDVGKAVARAVADPTLGGKTFELGGPAVFTFRELMALMLKEIGKRRLLLPLPWGVAGLVGQLGQLSLLVLGDGLVVPPVTADQVKLLRADNVVSGAYPGLAELGVTATTLETVLPGYLYRYRKGGQYADQEARELAAV
jgi:NADH dehydrogenase